MKSPIHELLVGSVKDLTLRIIVAADKISATPEKPLREYGNHSFINVN